MTYKELKEQLKKIGAMDDMEIVFSQQRVSPIYLLYTLNISSFGVVKNKVGEREINIEMR